MKLLKTFYLTLAMLVLGIFQASAADSLRPNIVLILADDLGYGDLSCYGQKLLQTPNLDRMAAEGMRFTRHYAGLTVCAPSRCVLMTGKHTGHAAVRTNYDPPMSDQTPTIARLLKAAGYATGAFGKWGIGDVIPEEDPNRKGFDTFYGYVDMYHAHNLFPPFMIRNGKREVLGNVLVPGSDAGNASGRGNGIAKEPIDYAPDRVVNEALKFIDVQAKQPFFLYLALNTPHANNEGGKSGLNRGMEVPDFGAFADRDWPIHEKGFARMMQDIDLYVARVLDKLRQHAIADKTLVLFTSDNGPHQEGGHLVDFFDSNGDLRGRKRDLYEGGIRVPAIASWPGRIPAGKICDHLTGFQDYLPTFCELAGIKAPESDGLSILPSLLGKTNDQAKHAYLYWEFYEGGGKQAIATDRWKAVRLNWIEQPDGPMEIYDLQSDPAETRDVASLHPEIVQQMAASMKQAHTAHSGIISLSNSKSSSGPASTKP
jgi:arylsulfatase A-like enzyme